jgi:mRNA interferase MazF
MNQLKFGDIVLLKFPFSDGRSVKRRPALIISESDDGDIIVCRITSNIYETNQDVYIDEWKNYGLKLPSVIRVHKIATLEKGIVEIVLGSINQSLKEKVKIILSNLAQ